MRPSSHITLFAASSLLSVTTQAAVITWNAAPSPVNTASDILSIGAPASDITYTHDIWPSGTADNLASGGAVNYGPDAATVNGVSFTAGGGSGDFWSADSGDVGLNNILGYHAAFGNDSDPWVLVISGLSENTAYMIQIIGIHDERGGGISDRTYSFQDTDGGAASPTLQRGTGGSVIGSFTTGSGETSIQINGLGSSDPGAAGVVVRAVPEPGSLALLITGGLVMLHRRRN
ncbi:MAG: PEP-CTERM sorting domain-containing protein [Phycisphaerales bacterium JB063]